MSGIFMLLKKLSKSRLLKSTFCVQNVLYFRQQDEHHSDSSPPNPEDGQLTAQEDRQQTP